MSEYVINHVPGMIELAGKTVDKFGKDQTGQIQYSFNRQGFRSSVDYCNSPDYAFFGCSLVFGVGVDQQHLFSALFNNSHNYGLAGEYNNHDVMTVLKTFLMSDLYHCTTNIAVVWHSRDSDCLPEFYNQLRDYNIKHFYCGTSLKQPQCYRFPPQQDQDVSDTHPGPKTHHMFSKMLWDLFDQS